VWPRTCSCKEVRSVLILVLILWIPVLLGVAVATLVPHADLAWISRLTGALILPSTEYITRSVDPTGTCAFFRLDTVKTLLVNTNAPDAASPRVTRYCYTTLHALTQNGDGFVTRRSKEKDTFMYFEGCPPRMGASVVLRGESYDHLDRLQKIVVELTGRLWTLRLEHALIHSMDDNGIAKMTTLSIYGAFRYSNRQ